MKPDGGSAYPIPAQDARFETWSDASGGGTTHFPPIPAQSGMSLRDAFAMAALQGIGLGNSGMGQEHIAALAYSIADAMIAERSKP